MPTHFVGSSEEIVALDGYIKLSRAAESVTQRINAHLHAAGLTISQFGVLEALYHLGPLPVGQLGEKILKSSGNMTLVVDNLERRDLVSRNRRVDDRRCLDVSLTPAGMELVAGLLPGHVAGVVNTMSALSLDELSQLSLLCRKLGLTAANNPAVAVGNEKEE